MRIYTAELLIFLIVAVKLSECQKWSDYNNVVKNAKNGRSSSYQDDADSSEKTAPAKSQQATPTVRHGIGSWGIIWITLTVIFTGVGVYYFVLFYPIVCKKERMYDVMEMTTVEDNWFGERKQG